MTMNPDNTRSTQGAAQEEAENIKNKAFDAAGQVADTAQQEASQVKEEAMKQARSLTDSAVNEVNAQASTQQKRLAEQSRTVTDDLARLARGERAESDMVNQFISMAADRAQKFTTQLENKEPVELLNDVRRFAARRPGTFLAIAAGIGLVAGRFTRGLSDNDGATPQTDTKADVPSPGVHQTPVVVPPMDRDLTDRIPDVAPSGYPDTAAGGYADLRPGGYQDPLAGGFPDDLTGPTTPGGRV